MSASIDQINTLHPKLRAIALQAYNEAVQATPADVHPVITQGYRTFDESDKLYQQGRTTPGEIVTNAKPGYSWHNYGLAIDFALNMGAKTSWNQNNPNWMTVVNIFKSHGFTWGGDWTGFKDYPHLEMKFGYTISQMLAKYQACDFIEGTQYVNI